MRRIIVAGSVALLASGPAMAFECPTEDEVRAGITKKETDHHKSRGYIEVGNFRFGPIKFGKVYQGVLTPDQDRCPVRVEYTCQLVWKNGESSDGRGGNLITYDFYKDQFDEWAYYMWSN